MGNWVWTLKKDAGMFALKIRPTFLQFQGRFCWSKATLTASLQFLCFHLVSSPRALMTPVPVYILDVQVLARHVFSKGQTKRNNSQLVL